MKTTMLVWYLISTYGGITWSPPVATLQDCQKFQAALATKSDDAVKRSTCVQVAIPVASN